MAETREGYELDRTPNRTNVDETDTYLDRPQGVSRQSSLVRTAPHLREPKEGLICARTHQLVGAHGCTPIPGARASLEMQADLHAKLSLTGEVQSFESRTRSEFDSFTGDALKIDPRDH